MIRIWNAYSCNNSGASRLVARFVDAARAKAVGDELRDLLVGLEYRGVTPHRRRSSALQALATLYGFDNYYDNGSYGTEEGPFVTVDEHTMIVHLDYGLGIGPGVPAYLKEQGATEVSRETFSTVHVSVLFAARLGVDPQLDAEIEAIRVQASRDHTVDRLVAPWLTEHVRGRLAVLRDAATVGLFVPIYPRDIARLRAWLVERGIDKAVIAIEEYADQDRFVALAAARCTACEGPLEYLDPRLHDIEAPQLVCKPCGGFYDLKAFVP